MTEALHPCVGIFRTRRVASPRASRGFAVMGTCMVLLLLGALAVMHAHKALVHDQDVVRHRQASQLAFDMAESGLAFAMARLNDTSLLQGASSSCVPSSAQFGSIPSGGQAFRRWNLPFQPTTAATSTEPLARNEVLGGLRAWCRLSPWPALEAQANLDCTCSRTDPQGVESSPMPSQAGPGFLLSFEPSSLDPWVLQIKSLGCRDLATCPSATREPAASQFASSAQARVLLSALAKPVPSLLTVPLAAITSAGPVTLCGAAASQGLMVHAGGPITSNDARCVAATVTSTAAEQPARRVASSDAALAAAAASWDALIFRLAGRTAFSVQQEVQSLQCMASGIDARARAASIMQMAARVQRPCQKVWVDGDVEWSEGHLGSPHAPMLLLVKGQFRLTATGRLHGIVAAESVLIDTPSDHLAVDGAVASSGGAVWLSGRIEPQTPTLARLAVSGHYVQVPGSWKDVP
jgi:hypothetical protein